MKRLALRRAASLFLVSLVQLYFTQAFIWLGISDRQRYVYLGPQVVDPRNLALLIFAIVALTVLYLRRRREKERQFSIEPVLG